MEQSLERTGRLLDLHGLGHVTLNQLTGGVFLTGFLLSLGSSAFLIGVVAALPLAAKLSQLYTSWQIERRGSWERTTRTGALWGRLPLLLAAFIPLLDLPLELASLLLVILIALSSLGGSIFEIGFLTWMAELIPAGRRGEFWGKRTRIAELFGIAVALVAAFLFDRWKEAHPGEVGGFTTLFLVGSIAGLVVVVFLGRLPKPEIEHRKTRREPLLATLKRPAADPAFRPLLTFVGLWGFAVGLIGPFTTVYMLEELHLSFLTATALNLVPAGLIALTQVYWGQLSDRFGCKPVLWSASFLIILVPALWMASSVDRSWPIIIGQVVSGFGWAAYHIAMNNLVLKLAPHQNRSSYVASIGSMFAVSQAVAPLCAGAMISIVKGMGADPLTPYYILFGTSAVLRMSIVPLLGKIREEGGAPLGHMIRVIGRFRSMSSSAAPDIIFDYAFTHLARVADFITREKSPPGPHRPVTGGQGAGKA